MKKAYALSQENEKAGQVGYMSSLGPTSFWLYDPRKVTYLLESNFSHLYGDIDGNPLQYSRLENPWGLWHVGTGERAAGFLWRWWRGAFPAQPPAAPYH